MIIRFTKAKNESKQDMLTCVRDDGSRTWWPLTPHFAQHDMLHYSVETTFGFREAFFGLIAGGRDIDSFGTRDGQKDTYTLDEGYVELIVGLFQVEMLNGTPQTSEEFLAMLTLTCQNNNWPMPEDISADKVDCIKAKMCDLSKQWRKLPGGEFIELIF